MNSETLHEIALLLGVMIAAAVGSLIGIWAGLRISIVMVKDAFKE